MEKHSITLLADAIKKEHEGRDDLRFDEDAMKKWIVDNRTYVVQDKKTLEVFKRVLKKS